MPEKAERVGGHPSLLLTEYLTDTKVKGVRVVTKALWTIAGTRMPSTTTLARVSRTSGMTEPGGSRTARLPVWSLLVISRSGCTPRHPRWRS